MAHLVGRGRLLIRRARKLYSDTDLVGLELKNTVYALDATTIDLCLSPFDWTPFRKAKGAVKLHTLLGPQLSHQPEDSYTPKPSQLR